MAFEADEMLIRWQELQNSKQSMAVSRSTCTSTDITFYISKKVHLPTSPSLSLSFSFSFTPSLNLSNLVQVHTCTHVYMYLPCMQLSSQVYCVPVPPLQAEFEEERRCLCHEISDLKHQLQALQTKLLRGTRSDDKVHVHVHVCIHCAAFTCIYIIMYMYMYISANGRLILLSAIMCT